MIISLIAAISDNNVIGKADGGIPWCLPCDSQHFRDYTAGKWMVLGRRTYNEMIGWFDDRTPIVVTRNPEAIASESIYTTDSIESAIEIGRKHGVDELIVSGGGELYEMALPRVDKMILTRVAVEISNGSVQFPEIDWQNWRLVTSENWPADNENSYSMRMEIWNRRR